MAKVDSSINEIPPDSIWRKWKIKVPPEMKNPYLKTRSQRQTDNIAPDQKKMPAKKKNPKEKPAEKHWARKNPKAPPAQRPKTVAEIQQGIRFACAKDLLSYQFGDRQPRFEDVMNLNNKNFYKSQKNYADAMDKFRTELDV